jgi:hypothetical protein
VNGDDVGRAEPGGQSDGFMLLDARPSVQHLHDPVVFALIEDLRRVQNALPGGDAPGLVDDYTHCVLLKVVEVIGYQVSGSSWTP